MCSATLSVVNPSIAHLRRIGVSGIPISSSSSSLSSVATSDAVLPCTISVSIDVAACEIATMPRDELLDEVGIPLTPIRLKCALLGLGVLKVALHRAKGTPLPEEWAGLADELDFGSAG